MLTAVRMVDVGGYKLAVTVRGTGPLVVFTSGIGEPGDNWNAVLGQLTGPATTVTYDRAGVGSSEPYPNRGEVRPYSFFASQLNSLLVALDLAGPVVPVGHSFGCLIVRVFAALWPERIRGLVLVEGSVPHMSLWPGDDGDLRDGDRPDAIHIDTTAGALEVIPLRLRVPAVVMTRTPGRWSSPLATKEVDDDWRRRHEDLAAELDAIHIIALDGGHRLNADAPKLVALAVGEITQAAALGRPARFEPTQVTEAGGRLA
jgi:alpha-beta hydrolase superfamily lysophospholipase